jgi:ribosomal protein S25
MTRPDVVMTEQRQREVEGLARTMLLQSVSISPYYLADRAKINWFLARDILRGLTRKGHATVLPSGRFGRPPELPAPPSGKSR